LAKPRILIANRGEVAVRIIRTCREMDIPSVAVYSDADRDALHVQMADSAYRIGPALAAESYLSIGAILDAARKAKALEIGCTKLTRPDERAEFVRWEVRRAGGRISPDAVSVLLDAVGSDLRELAAVSAQLVSDSGGEVSVELVRAYHRGRAEVSGFAVADLAVVGRSGPALEALRFALSVGVPHVVIADALADGVRSIARVSAAGRGDQYAIAKKLGMPPWKVKRASSQARGWSEDGLREAFNVVALLNADVKGEAVDPSYALELAIRRLGTARGAASR
jgi:DNA polymerase-3 subunit delta